MYSILNKLSGYIYFDISKNIASYYFLLDFKIVEYLQCIFTALHWLFLVILDSLGFFSMILGRFKSF